MTEQGRQGGSDGGPGGGSGTPAAERLAPGEQEQLVYALETRFAASREAAVAAVREAERELADARDRRARAERAAAGAQYTSDPLIFMRQSVVEEVDALQRKTTGKRVRASYRFLLDRSVELAAAEVARFHDDRAEARRAAEDGLEACLEEERQAAGSVEAARLMRDRVLSAEQSARRGLTTMVEKLAGRHP